MKPVALTGIRCFAWQEALKTADEQAISLKEARVVKCHTATGRGAPGSTQTELSDKDGGLLGLPGQRQGDVVSQSQNQEVKTKEECWRVINIAKTIWQ